MRITSWKVALKLARCAGEDAANRRMRRAGRKIWAADDYTFAARTMSCILEQLGYGDRIAA